MPFKCNAKSKLYSYTENSEAIVTNIVHFVLQAYFTYLEKAKRHANKTLFKKHNIYDLQNENILLFHPF